MLQRRRNPHLPQKAILAEGCREILAQNLDRDFPLVFQVVGEVDRGHAAGAEFALDGVAVRKGGGQAGGGSVTVTGRALPTLRRSRPGPPDGGSPSVRRGRRRAPGTGS